MMLEKSIVMKCVKQSAKLPAMFRAQNRVGPGTGNIGRTGFSGYPDIRAILCYEILRNSVHVNFPRLRLNLSFSLSQFFFLFFYSSIINFLSLLSLYSSLRFPGKECVCVFMCV